MFKSFLAIFVIIQLLNSCTSNSGYFYKQKRFYFFNSSYGESDTVYVSDYIMYGTYEKEGLNNWGIVFLNEDSIFNIFMKSFVHLEFPANLLPTQFNKITDSFRNNHYLNYKKINKVYIKNLAKINSDKTVLIPIIRIKFNKNRGLTTSGADPYPYYICHLSIAVFIIKNDKIIYYKQMRHVESVDGEFHPYKYEDFHIPIPQEHWDGLVREVMKEYIERLR